MFSEKKNCPIVQMKGDFNTRHILTDADENTQL